MPNIPPQIQTLLYNGGAATILLLLVAVFVLYTHRVYTADQYHQIEKQAAQDRHDKETLQGAGASAAATMESLSTVVLTQVQTQAAVGELGRQVQALKDDTAKRMDALDGKMAQILAALPRQTQP